MPDPARDADTPGRAGLRLSHRGLRRVASQAGLVAALLAVFAVCSAVAGTGALLLTTGHTRALSAAVALADGDEHAGGADLATVIVSTADPAPADAATLLPLLRRSLADTAAPYRATVSLWATTPLLFVDAGEVRRGYLVDADTITAGASLDAGSWPTARTQGGRIPVAIASPTADALGIGVGAELRLSSERGEPEAAGSYRLVVTGTFTPSRTPAWDRDLLRGRGHDPDYLGLPTFGPFVVAPGTLEALAAPLDRVVAVLDPDLAGDAGGVPGLVQRVDALATDLQDAAGPAVSSVRVLSGLGPAFARMRAELGVTEALVLAVLVLVLALGAATAALLARALVARRGGELTLLRERGASSGQLARGAAAEALTVAVLAAVAAAPLAIAGFDLAAPAAPAAHGSRPGPELALALLAGAAVPAAVLVAVTVRQRPRGAGRTGPGALARSGVDVMLGLLAVACYLQLRSHVPTGGTPDPLLVTAPALCVLAAAALATRLLPVLARVAERAAGRGRGIVAPMAAWQIARGQATPGAFLAVLAATVGVLGVAFVGTWPSAQHEQAAALVGADLVVGMVGGPGTAADLGAATGGTATPVSDRAVVLGTRPEGVKLLALDAGLADRLPAGRPPDGESWPDVLAPLAPSTADAPLVLDGTVPEVVLTGGLRAGPAVQGLPAPVVTATPTLVLADDTGATTTRVGSGVALDGRPHPIAFPAPGLPGQPSGAWRVVAIDLLLSDHTEADLLGWGNNPATIELSLTVAGASAADGGSWDAAGGQGEADVRPQRVTLDGDTVRAVFTYSALGLSWQDAHFTLLSFPAGTDLPVALDDALARELGLAGGDRIALRWGTTALTAAVVRTVPYVPGHVREAALLTDLGSLQRALLSAGTLEPATDRWWVASPRPGAADALRASGWVPVTDRAELAAALRDGPLRAPLPAAWLLAIAAAVGLAVTGSAANAAAQARSRSTTLARVRALGLSRQEAFTSHLAQHAGLTTAGVALGAACGAALAALLVPLLVTSPTGEPAIPAAALVWSAGPTAAVLAGILGGALLAGLPAALAAARRSTVAALRAGEAA